jgi:hypothetical protein
MAAAGQSVAVENLVQNGVSCDALDVRVDVVNTIDPGIVRVVIDCVVDNGGLNLLGPEPRRLSVSSVEVIDRWRVDS